MKKTKTLKKVVTPKVTSPKKARVIKKKVVVKSKAADEPVFELRLYIAGNTQRSLAALNNLKIICSSHLKGKYKIEVIDLLISPQLAKGDQIFAIPTLVRKLPVPIKKIIGDLSDLEKVIVGLNLKELR